MAYSVSLHYDRRLAADDLAGSRAHVRGLGRGRSSSRRGHRPAGRPRPGGGGAGRRDVRVRARRRGHPHRGGAPGHRDRRRRRGQAAHRPEPQRPGRHRPPPLRQAGADRPWPPEVIDLQAVLLAPGRRGRRTSTCRATPTCSGPSRCCWPTTCWPTAGPWPATSTGCVATVAPARRVAARAPGRWPARRCRSIPTAWPRTSGSPAASRTRWTPCPTATSWPRPSSTWPCSASTCPGSGEEIVLWSSEEFGFVGPRRRLRHRELDAPPEEEPRRGRAGPGQGGPADRQPDRAPGRPSRACHWRTTGTCRRTRSRSSTPWTRSHLALARHDRAAGDRSPSRPTACEAAADGPAVGRGGPGRVAGQRGDAVPPGPRRGRPTGPRRPSSATCPWPSWSRPTPLSAPRRSSCSNRAWRSPDGRRREGPDPVRCPSSGSGSRSGSRPIGAGWPRRGEPGGRWRAEARRPPWPTVAVTHRLRLRTAVVWLAPYTYAPPIPP